MINWKKAIKDVLPKNEKIIACTLTEKELLEEFDDGYGGHNGKPFTAWSENYVFFPVVYDGAEWVSAAPRNPCDEVTGHIGGE